MACRSGVHTQVIAADDPTPLLARTARLGGEAVFQRLARRAEALLPDLLPGLWALMLAAPEARAARLAAHAELPDSPGPLPDAQALLTSAYLLRSLAPCLHGALHAALARLLPTLFACLVHRRRRVRTAFAQALVALVQADVDAHLCPLVCLLLPLIQVCTLL